MKKPIQTLIVCGLMGIFFVGCGEKKSAGIIKCEEEVTKLSIEMPKKLYEGGTTTEEQYKKSMAEGEASVKACAHYEGGPSNEDLGPWIMGGDLEKNAKQYMK
jgi:hypothetical protein